MYHRSPLLDPSVGADSNQTNHNHHNNGNKSTTGVTSTSNSRNVRSPIIPGRRTRSSNNNNSSNGITIDSGGNSHNYEIISTQQPSLAIPGRPRRKRIMNSNNKKRQQQFSMIPNINIDLSLWIAILLWYSLGVLSIASSKILLTGSQQVDGIRMVRVNPLSLTLQQLVIGVSLLRFLLYIRFLNSSGVKPWPPPISKDHYNNKDTDSRESSASSTTTTGQHDLFMSAMCFAFGFLATNYAFAGSAASFVETIKAAEPITSSTVAAVYGLEIITTQQKASLGTIVIGVLLSTLGNSTHSKDNTQQSMFDTIQACTIVMIANLFFSFRGLYQKLFRKQSISQGLDDLNLQFRMQYYGVMVLCIPTLLFDIVPYIVSSTLKAQNATKTVERQLHVTFSSNGIIQYLLLSLFNGVAFTCYNLASTWILSRISVVHHAALNCIRRVFAVIVTSIYFGIPITFTGAAGIMLAVVGFMAYTHYKVLQQQQQQSTSSSAISSNQSRSKQLLSTLLPMSIHDNHGK
jgi:drug/metabolite transporter (DMT)-like permease